MAKKIQFNAETIDEIRKYIESEFHTVAEASNRFAVSQDTIRRVMFENNIRTASYKRVDPNVAHFNVSDDIVAQIVHLFTDTDATMATICKEVKREDYIVKSVLHDNFTEEEIKARKSRLYRKSKLGDLNPMTGKRGAETSQWKGGIVPDGQGYLMIQKPDWYTGRNRSDYIFYHSYVMCVALGLTEIPKGFVVHHIDHNPYNNDISNLALLNTSAHSKLHAIEKKMCKVQRLSTPE